MMDGVKRPEILALGFFLGMAFSYCIGGKVDDALGHDTRSMWIGMAVAVVVMAVFAVPAVVLSMRSGEKR
jgi:hypothetical protein